MPNAEKTGAVAEIAERLSSSSAAVITEYRGLSVKQVTDLRRALGRETTYAVVKNTLTRRAAAEAGVAIDDSLLVGPTAIAFVTGDPVEAAKGLRDFARANPLLVIKGGIMEGRSLSAAEVARIADLETREVLLAKLAGAIKALPAKAAGLFQAPLTQMALLAKALEDKKPAQAGEAAQAPAADAASDTATDAAPDTATDAAPDTAAEPSETATEPSAETTAEPAE